MPWYDQYRKDIGPETRRALRVIENEAREKLGLDPLPDPESREPLEVPARLGTGWGWTPERIERHTADNLTYRERLDYALRLAGTNG